MFILIDNYDSFTYNLYHQMAVLADDIRVIRNDAASAEEIASWAPEGIVISPGPGIPEQAGNTMAIIEHLSGSCPILGICLGHQAIGAVFGGKVVRAGAPVHGKLAKIQHNNQGVFEGMAQGFDATRYHSLILERNSLPDCFEITAETAQEEGDGLIMGIRHTSHPTEGVQFHPESIATDGGQKLMENFISSARAFNAPHKKAAS